MEKTKREPFDSDAYIEEVHNNAKIEEDKKSKYYDWGIKSIYCCVGYIIVSVMYYLFTGLMFQENVKSTIEGVFIGSGFFASLAGILFIVDNLALQRKSLIKQTIDIAYTRVEIKQQVLELDKANQYYEEQNKIMQKQQNENTFFILIDLHKKLYTELNVNEITPGGVSRTKYFEDLENKITKNSKQYEDSITNEVFSHFHLTTYNPKFYFSIYHKTRSENLEMYIENVKDIIRFIFTNLENSEFYHKKFYNLLFPSEKYLIGMCQELNMFDFYSFYKEPGQLISYKKYYENADGYNYIKGYVPALNIETYGYIANTRLEDLQTTDLYYKISILNDKNKQQLTLVSVNVFLFNGNEKIDEFIAFDEVSRFVNDEFIYDFTNVIERLLFIKGGLARNQYAGQYKISYSFLFNYDKHRFTVIYNDGFLFSSLGTFTLGNYI